MATNHIELVFQTLTKYLVIGVSEKLDDLVLALNIVNGIFSK